jgi:tRNA U34 5-methylaminomethyl-2-thiouridine-forming methyltransferase MnmC
LVRLANGVHSVRSVRDDEVFHPVVGPEAEAEARYVRQVGLAGRLAAGGGPFVVWDVGLGAAANALTVLRAAQPFSRPLRLLSFDHTVAPLRFALENRESLGYLEGFQEVLEELLDRGRARFRNGSHEVCWELALGDFPAWIASAETLRAAQRPHLILYDAFSPAKNPAMWTLPVFQGLFARLSPERSCLMPTYSRSTLLRVTLLLAGFHVGAGHATGEKEETTIAANSLEALEEPLPREWLERVRRSRSAEPLAGGSYCQRPLSSENWRALLEHPQFR